jgi:hypothetical protein
MATLFAVRDGIRDAHAGRPAYFWAVCTHPAQRRELIRQGWRAVRKIFILALALDTMYQLLVFRGLRPIQGLLVAVLLALVPYTVFRGPANRIARALARASERRRSARV